MSLFKGSYEILQFLDYSKGPRYPLAGHYSELVAQQSLMLHREVVDQIVLYGAMSQAGEKLKLGILVMLRE